MKMKKIYSLLLAFVFSVSAICSIAAVSPNTVFAAQNQQKTAQAKQQNNSPRNKAKSGKCVIDQTGTLSSSDLQKIDKALLENSEKSGAILCVAILNQGLNEKGIGAYANNFADNCAKSSGKGAIVFVQDVKSRKWYIATDKKMKPALGKDSTDNKQYVEYISTDIVPHLKSNDLVKAYSTFAVKAGELAEFYNRTGDAMTVVDTTIEKIVIAIVALVIGYLYASARRSSRVAAMSNVATAAGASDYLNQGSFSLYASNDSYLYQTVTVVPRSKSDDTIDGDMSFSSSDGDHGGGGGSY